MKNLIDGLKEIINSFIKAVNSVLTWFGIENIPLLGEGKTGWSMNHQLGEAARNRSTNVFSDYVSGNYSNSVVGNAFSGFAAGNVFYDYASGNLGGVVNSFGANSSDLYKSMSDANQDVVSAILAGATQVVSAVNEKESDITLDGDSIARKLYRPLQSAGKIVGSSLIEGVH